MKKQIASLLLAMSGVYLLCGCEMPEVEVIYDSEEYGLTTESEASETETQTETAAEAETETLTEAETEALTEAVTETETSTEAETEPEIVWGETYTTPEDVADYLHLYGELPENFITKKEARNLGWESSEGNLWEVAPGMSIGGDYFGNYEGILPDGDYRECDVNFDGGYRGAERIIYGEDGSIYYTDDHYKTFTQLY